MKKIIHFIIFIISLFIFFNLTTNIFPIEIKAVSCSISAPNSVKPGESFKYSVSGDLDFVNFGMAVYSEKGEGLECKYLTPELSASITAPSSGNSITLKVVEVLPPDSLRDNCYFNEIKSEVCSKNITLIGKLSTSCTASVSKGSPYDKVIVNIQDVGGITPVLYIISPKNETLITRTVKAGVNEISMGYTWKSAGSYTAEIREAETATGKGALLTSCSFYYDGITPLDELNEQALESTEYPEFGPTINKFINISIAIGGIIAFILIIAGGLQIILSAGNPDRVKAGKELITSAIAGLMLIIFSVFILRLIGYDILKIPGFNP